MLVWAHTKVFHCLTRCPEAAEQNGVRTGRGAEGELVEGDSFTAGSDNSLLGSAGEAQSGDGEFGNLRETNVISDGADLNDDFRVAVRCLGSFFHDARK